MQYRTVEQESSSSWGRPPRNNLATRDRTVEERIERMVAENAVVIFSVSTCCMCTAMKRLFTVMGVSPTVHELDLLLDPIRRKDMERALSRILGGGSSATPVVFVGGKLVGSMDRVMASHISGTLVPLLKQAGALWL